jgi:hypothetical protein
MNKPTMFLEAIMMGEKYGYPSCCVWEFACDIINGRNSGQLRGLDNSFTFVPCSNCKKAAEKFLKLMNSLSKEEQIKLGVEVTEINEVERLVRNLHPHVKNHENKECECWVKIDGKTYRLTGGVSTYDNRVVLFATTTGNPTFFGD